MQWGTTLRNAWLDLIESTIGTGMRIRLLTGPMPADCAASETGTLICEITCPSDYFDPASGGIMAKNGAWAGTSSAIGVIGYGRFLDSAGSVVHCQSLISKAASIVTNALTAVNGVVLNFASTAGVEVGEGVRGTGISVGAIVLAVTSTTVTINMACLTGIASSTRITFGDTSGDTFLNVVDITAIGQSITVDEFSLVAPGA